MAHESFPAAYNAAAQAGRERDGQGMPEADTPGAAVARHAMRAPAGGVSAGDGDGAVVPVRARVGLGGADGRVPGGLRAVPGHLGHLVRIWRRRMDDAVQDGMHPPAQGAGRSGPAHGAAQGAVRRAIVFSLHMH